MRQLYFLLIALLVFPIAKSQVTSDPAIAVDDQAVTVFFDASKGTGGLAGYDGDIYAHTGVITDKSSSGSDWKYVKAGWTENIEACKLTKVSGDNYKLEILPSIREFYNVPQGETIEQIAFVFRSSDSKLEGKGDGGKDIYVEVFQSGLVVGFSSPDGSWLIGEAGQSYIFEGNSTEIAQLGISIDGQTPVKEVNGKSISHSQLFETAGNYEVVLTGTTATETDTDTIQVCILGPVAEQSLPAGVRDGINYVSNTEVTFVLRAPGKQNVLLIGDFNGWQPSNDYQFNKDGDKWWYSLSGLTAGQEYAFQYLVDGDILIADPYSEKVLDPYNDKYIPEEVYPNLKAYPDDKTNGIVGVFQTAKADYDWGTSDFTPVPKNELVIYELLIRDFVSSHSIKDVGEKLDYLQTLGVNAIELLPFNEFEGNSSWGYNTSFHFATDKYYGTDTDFKDFIKECHSRGIAVIMDMVLNHAFHQNPLVQLYFDPAAGDYGQPAADNPWFNQTSPNTDYFWGNDFNHESEATKYYVGRVIEYWMEEFKIDGFRFDFTKGFTNTPGNGWAYDQARIDNLIAIHDTIQAYNPNGLMICEHLADNSEEKVLSKDGIMLWGNINHNYTEASMGYVDKSDLAWTSYLQRGWEEPNLIPYMESHDEERIMYKNITYGKQDGAYSIRDLSTALDRAQLCAVFYLAIPGPKMIWQFGELGYDYSIDHNDRVGEKPIRWDFMDNPDRMDVYNTYGIMLEARKKYPVFQTDDFSMSVGDNIAIKRIELRHVDGNAILVGNFGTSQAIFMPKFSETGWWYETFTNDSVNVENTSLEITLQAGEYRLYTPMRVETALNHSPMWDKIDVAVYPNPVESILNIEAAESIQEIRVYDPQGRQVLHRLEDFDSLDLSGLTAGYYILLIQTRQGVYSQKILKR